MDINQIKELAAIMKENKLNKIEINEGESHILLEAGKNPPPPPQSFFPSQPPMGMAMPVNTPSVFETGSSSSVENTDGLFAQKTPLVGTLYLAPSAGAEPFVKEGSHVKKGDVICIVESMKVLNDICADQSGTITKVCVKNEEVVEYGQTLFMIKPE